MSFFNVWPERSGEGTKSNNRTLCSRSEREKKFDWEKENDGGGREEERSKKYWHFSLTHLSIFANSFFLPSQTKTIYLWCV